MPGAGGIGGSDYGSDAYTRGMRLMAMGDILKGGNGGNYFNYMQQLAAAQQADARFAAQQAAIEEQRAYERSMAEQAAAQQAAMLEAARQGMQDYFSSVMPNPVMPFNAKDPTGADVAANAMAYVRPEMFPGLPQSVINDAARNNSPASSALVSMFYNMPDDVADSTRVGYDDGMATFAYNDEAAREWARQNAPEYGYGFEGAGPQAKFDAQQSMPMPVAPERLAQIMTNPMVPDEIKDMVLARFGGEDADMKWIDGIGMVDMNNPPPELMAGNYEAPADPRTMQATGAQLIEQFGIEPGGIEPNALYNIDPDGSISRIGGAGTTVNVGSEKLETEYDKERGKGLAAQMADIETQAGSARGALASLEVMDQLMDDPGFYSGGAGEGVLVAKRFAQALGMDPEGIDSMDAFNAQAKAAALDAMGGSLGTGFSNADRDFVLDQVPGLDKTPEGNRLLIAIQRQIQQRRVDIEKLARQYEVDNGSLRGFSTALAEWSEANPVFAPDFISQFRADTDLNPITPEGPQAPGGLGVGAGASGSWGLPSSFANSAEAQATAKRLNMTMEQLWQSIIEQGNSGAWQ